MNSNVVASLPVKALEVQEYFRYNLQELRLVFYKLYCHDVAPTDPFVYLVAEGPSVSSSYIHIFISLLFGAPTPRNGMIRVEK